MLRGFGIALALAAALSSRAAAEEPGRTALDDPPQYAGKYRDDAAIRAVLARIPAMRRDAIAHVKERLGLEPADPDSIRVDVADALPADASRIATFREPMFQTSTEAEGGPYRILVHLEAVAAGASDLAEELRHEMTHAVMRERAGSREVYRRIPKWLREGLALHCADQTRERTSYIVHSASAEKGVEALFPGLDVGEHSLDRYAEDALAIDYLAAKRGATAVKDLAGRLVRGEEPRAAVAAVSRQSWEDFAAAARAHGIEFATKLRAREHSDYAEIRALDRKREYEAVIARAAAFARKHPRSPLLLDALYWKGKAERLRGKEEAAIATLTRIVEGERRLSHYLDEAWYQLGMAQIARKDASAAAESFATILRDHPTCDLLDRALVRLARCDLLLGDAARARERLTLFDRSFPKSSVADDAAELRKELAAK